MARLGRVQPGVEVAQRGVGRGVGEQREALAAARLDQRAAQQRVDEPLRAPRARVAARSRPA